MLNVGRSGCLELGEDRCVARGRKKMVNVGGWVTDIQEKIPESLSHLASNEVSSAAKRT